MEGIPLSALPKVAFSALVASMIGASGAIGIVGVILPTLMVFRAMKLSSLQHAEKDYHTFRRLANFFLRNIPGIE
jgi:hypothetical protein